MLTTVSEFRHRVLNGGIFGLVQQLVDLTGRQSPNEQNAWVESFTRLAKALDQPALSGMHLYLGDPGNLSLEYRLPASASWCDVVLLGNDGSASQAVILELKHWDTSTDIAARGGLIDRPTELVLHPSEQVRGYVEYCRHFHSAVQESSAIVNGCVVFTRAPVSPAYRGEANRALTTEYPCFGIVREGEIKETIHYLNRRLVRPDPGFAQAFEAGHYRQDRRFIQSIGGTLRDKNSVHLVLLDEQRKGLLLAVDAVHQALSGPAGTRTRKVLVIVGPPGSGKSAIAARLWAEIAVNNELPSGDLAFVTTSSAQNDVIDNLFGRGAGIVKKASLFAPMTMDRASELKVTFPAEIKAPDDWRENLKWMEDKGLGMRVEDMQFLLSIVDEAHALVNPEVPDAAIGPIGFAPEFGPLGFHIIRGSAVSVFLLDPKQGFRDKETTTIADIQKWAHELDAEVLPIVSLEGRQFRCGGSVEYIEWLEGILDGEAASRLAELATYWRGPMERPAARFEAAEEPPKVVVPFPNPRKRFAFEIVDSPAALDAALAAQFNSGRSVRLVSSYARKWVTKKERRPPSELPVGKQDFQLTWHNLSGSQVWNRVWNWGNAPQKLLSWVDPEPGVPMHDDPLAEVGCPYTVRGFDYDYLGVLWLEDLRWDGKRWLVDIDYVFETGLTRHKSRAKKEKYADGPMTRELVSKVIQGYRILLSRAVRGLYVWCADPATASQLRRCLGSNELL